MTAVLIPMKKSKGGRPKKSDLERLERQLTVQITNLEYFAIKAIAADEGVSISEMLRSHVQEVIRNRLTQPDKDRKTNEGSSNE